MKEIDSSVINSLGIDLLDQAYGMILNDPSKSGFVKISEVFLQSGNNYRIGHMYSEGYVVEQDFEKARVAFEKGAEKGDYHCKVALSYFYKVGLGGFDIDKEKASLLMLSAAPHSLSILKFEKLYEEGMGTEKDYSVPLTRLDMIFNDDLTVKA